MACARSVRGIPFDEASVVDRGGGNALRRSVGRFTGPDRGDSIYLRSRSHIGVRVPTNAAAKVVEIFHGLNAAGRESALWLAPVQSAGVKQWPLIQDSESAKKSLTRVLNPCLISRRFVLIYLE